MGLVAPDPFEAASVVTAEAHLDAAVALAEDAGGRLPLGHAWPSAISLIPLMVAAMFACHSSSRRPMIFSSLSGIFSMTTVMPDGPGPIWAQYRSRVPDPSGASSSRQTADGTSGSPTAQPKRRTGSKSTIVLVVSHSPRAGWKLRPVKRALSRGEPSASTQL